MIDKQLASKVFKHPVHVLAFGFGSGLSPKAPGSAGTVVAVILYLFLAQLPLTAYLSMLLVTFAAGIYLCGRSSRLLGVHDHGGIVWDEFVRLFDILKPFPINVFDKHVHGGLGIMIDDAIAGTFAWICLQLIAFGVAT